jgi:hypothetical protein
MLLKGFWPARLKKRGFKFKIVFVCFILYLSRKVNIRSMLLNDLILDFLFHGLLVSASSFHEIFVKLVKNSPSLCDLFFGCLTFKVLSCKLSVVYWRPVFS